MSGKSAECRRVIAHHSKSFALASRLLAPNVRDEAVALYAWCRRCDDAVDLAPATQQATALASLRSELAEIAAGRPIVDLIPAAFQEVLLAKALPVSYPQDLLNGMEMDVGGVRYETFADLLLYCYRVAGVIGLMMCHVLGVSDDEALAHATNLGIAMQLTNIARDVAEDRRRGRLYIPKNWLSGEAASDDPSSNIPLSKSEAAAMASAVRRLLDAAEKYYRSGDEGLHFLRWRSALAIRTARAVYSAIGKEIRRGGCDVGAGRAFLTQKKKLLIAVGAVIRAASEIRVRRSRPKRTFVAPKVVFSFDDLVGSEPTFSLLAVQADGRVLRGGA